MNIYEFVSRFDDVIPYDVEITIGGRKAKEVIYDKSKKSSKNYRGKMYPFYEKGTRYADSKYLNAEDISLPIDIKVNCDQAKFITFDDKKDYEAKLVNPIRYTNKKSTDHQIRIMDTQNRQIAYIDLRLNESGDIKERFCSYRNEDGTHEIMRFTRYELDEDGQLIRTGCTTYTEIDQKNNIETEVNLYEANGVIKSTTISTKKVLLQEERAFQSITDLISDITGENIYSYVTKCYYQGLEDSQNRVYVGIDNYTFREDLTKWYKDKEHAESWKKRDYEQYRTDACHSFQEYVENEENNIMRNIAGEYAGQLYMHDDTNSTLYIRTKESDFNQNNFFYYTKVDLTGCDPFFGINPCYEDEIRDEEYFTRIENARGFSYVTQEIEGEEVLIWTRNKNFEQAEEEWREIFINPYEQLSKIKPGKILNKTK